MSSPFFKEVKRKRPAALVTKFLRDLESGVFQTPKSFDVLSNFRTEELKLNKAGQSLRVAYHESPLILAFCRKYPQAKSQPISLSSFEPPIAKQFALKQLKLMVNERLPEEVAFTRVEKDMMPQIVALTQQTLGTDISQLQLVQQEEEGALQSALLAVSEGKLPVRTSAASRGGPDANLLKSVDTERRRKPKPE